MKHVMLILMTLFFMICPGLVHASNSNADSTTRSFLWGLYRSKTILTGAKKEKLNQVKISIEKEIFQLQDRIQVKIKSDTVPVPKHFTFFGGLLTSPKLTDDQKRSKEIKKEIARLTNEIEKLELQKKKIDNLEKRDKKFIEKGLLWGIIRWDSKRKANK